MSGAWKWIEDDPNAVTSAPTSGTVYFVRGGVEHCHQWEWRLQMCPRCRGKSVPPQGCLTCDGSGVLAVSASGAVKKVAL